MFFIPRILPKPGMAPSTEDNYAALLLHAKNLATKTPTFNVTIQQKNKDEDKENEAAPVLIPEQKDSGSKKKVCFCYAYMIYPYT